MKLIQKSVLHAREGIAAPSAGATAGDAALHVIARVILQAKEQQQQLQQLHARKKIK